MKILFKIFKKTEHSSPSELYFAGTHPLMNDYLNQRTLFPTLIASPPSPGLGLVVVIPCHDEDQLLRSLQCLENCERPGCDVEIIVVINAAANAPEAVKIKNRETFDLATSWANENPQPHLRFHFLHFDDLPPKHAGVGLARKIGMDEACRRLESAGNPSGVIACFDADSRCESNYLQALEAHFSDCPKARACSIYFEHPLEGDEFEQAVYDAIAAYELHLRYYVHAQRWAGFPHAGQTVGSSMAVRCDAYQQQGGMNRRQAGEDFYFLHKFIPLGNFSEITATKVIPSPRPSHRVPFGTGKAVGEMLASGDECLTYHPQSFRDLKALFTSISGLYFLKKEALPDFLEGMPESVRQFLDGNDFTRKLAEIQSNTSNEGAFRQRFFRWFDAFLGMKFVHFARDNFHPDVAVAEAASWLAKEEGMSAEGLEVRELLRAFRQCNYLTEVVTHRSVGTESL